MKVIVVTEAEIGGHITNVYEYDREAYIEMVRNEIRWASECNGEIENIDEVEDWIEAVDNGEDPYDISIIENDRGMHYEILTLMQLGFWSTNINGYAGAQAEIDKAIKVGTTLDDIEDYLKDLLELNKINVKDYTNLMDYSKEIIGG